MLNMFKKLYNRFVLPVQGVHELIKNPVTNTGQTHQYYCTRCNRNAVDCEVNGCSKGPCPMDLVCNKPWVQEVKQSKTNT